MIQGSFYLMCYMDEIWKDIEGYEKYYQVSNLGNVRSVERIVIDRKSIRNFKSKILTRTKNTHGYLQVFLSKNGKIKTCRVHVLVAKAFLPNPANRPEINHINANRLDNSVSNLEWVTSSENSKHAFNMGRQKNTFKRKVFI